MPSSMPSCASSKALRRVMPPIFLLVSAFLINITLARMIALEREQIGLLKALGYGPLPIAAHYIKFVLAITFVGIADRRNRRSVDEARASPASMPSSSTSRS